MILTRFFSQTFAKTQLTDTSVTYKQLVCRHAAQKRRDFFTFTIAGCIGSHLAGIPPRVISKIIPPCLGIPFRILRTLFCSLRAFIRLLTFFAWLPITDFFATCVIKLFAWFLFLALVAIQHALFFISRERLSAFASMVRRPSLRKMTLHADIAIASQAVTIWPKFYKRFLSMADFADTRFHQMPPLRQKVSTLGSLVVVAIRNLRRERPIPSNSLLYHSMRLTARSTRT
jgi:hypothetical protein